MAFTPILTDQPISYAYNRSYYRNAAREALAGTPVYFAPYTLSVNDTGDPGPRYVSTYYTGGVWYNYNNIPAQYLDGDRAAYGNCTWWCIGRAQDMGYAGSSEFARGDAKNWYANFTGSKSTNINNLSAGDIIVFRDANDGAGHVMIVEAIQNNTAYISQSAYSIRPYWDGYACRVNSFSLSELTVDSWINMYRNTGTAAFNIQVIGYLHLGLTPGPGPGPGPTPETPQITITPGSYSVTMAANENYKDFPFNIVISGIPAGQTVSGGNTYPGLSRIANTGWTYTDYQISGVTYRRASKSQTLRYEREQASAYTTTKYMYFNLSFATGNISTSTPMYINVEDQGNEPYLIPVLASIVRRRRNPRYTVNNI